MTLQIISLCAGVVIGSMTKHEEKEVISMPSESKLRGFSLFSGILSVGSIWPSSGPGEPWRRCARSTRSAGGYFGNTGRMSPCLRT